MTRTFKVLSMVLSYPTEPLQAAVDEMRSVILDEALLTDQLMHSLSSLLNEIAQNDLYELQERYVLLFDRTRSLSLHLFEHVHGESRERGQAMIDLAQVYEQSGLHISNRELPDYLPLFLEYLSTIPLSEARALLAQPLHIFVALGARLNRRSSVYATPFQILEHLASAEVETEAVQALLKQSEDDPEDLEQLDQLWQESEVVFGPGTEQQGGCSQTMSGSTSVQVAIPTRSDNQNTTKH